MKSGNKNNLDAGFSLFEILIAFTLFAVFILAYMSSQGQNVETSIKLQEEVVLQRLCENKINEIIMDPPELREALTIRPEEGSFEGEYENYAYSIEYKRFKVPKLDLLQAPAEDEEEALDPGAQQNAAISKKIFEQMESYISEAIWQVVVTVKNKQTEFNYSLSTWLANKDAKVRFNL